MKVLTVLLVLGLLAHAPAPMARATQVPLPAVTTSTPVPLIYELATSKSLPGWMFASFESGPTKYSRDGGHTWFPVASQTGAHLVKIIPKQLITDTPRLLVTGRGAVGVSVYRSGDLGQTWAQESFPNQCNTDVFGINRFQAIEAYPHRLYVQTSCYHVEVGIPEQSWYVMSVYGSRDSAISWQYFSKLVIPSMDSIVQAPLITSTIYLETNQLVTPYWHASSDGGDTFHKAEFELKGSGSIKFSRLRLVGIGAGDTLYAEVFSRTKTISDTTTETKFFAHSVNGGKTWMPYAVPSSCNASSTDHYLAHPTITELVFLRCSIYSQPITYFRSTNFGETWIPTEVSNEMNGILIELDQGNPGRLLGVCHRADNRLPDCSGLWYSDDGAETWVPLTKDFSGPKVYLPALFR